MPHSMFIENFIDYSWLWWVINGYKMATTIQVSEEMKENLDRMKLFERETYNEILERILEDEKELNEKTKAEVEEARKRINSGKFLTHEEVRKRIGL